MEYLNSIVTLIVGLSAYYVYYASKKHAKESAANIIIMDIRHAEQIVQNILEKGFVDIWTREVLLENNWSKYKHLFVKDFGQDDFASFNRFFDSCVEMSDARMRIRDTFYISLNAKAEILQQKLADVEDPMSPAGVEKRNLILSQINQENLLFEPVEPRDRMMRNLQMMGKLSNTIAFEKLKVKAGINA
ncbi:hypothetical protein [Vibrio lentus]|uniref:Uncharacterized protein n=1 Tax=Vibrio lentus TaxID=136468 RepID=A0A4U2FYF7_9VIBR|nr:hypothetical protein [Vibrio lentus]MCC4781656.1 hypothetical protein [Vibrio lentus]PMJ04864.1 hypothetical protein BCU31_09865 [Vibrio lentus]PML06863.1 hypothetical protein BCT85_22995 [Vibrio lentus]TKF97531.1 hypothetical protein FCV71_04155 [Vibrio lentus]TKG01337.1 hypothetical protein FCV91_23720 [Vibrio lentus]